MKRRERPSAERAPAAPQPVRTIYVVTYTLCGHEHGVYFREDFPDAASADSFIEEIGRAAEGRESYTVTGFFELRAAS